MLAVCPSHESDKSPIRAGENFLPPSEWRGSLRIMRDIRIALCERFALPYARLSPIGKNIFQPHNLFAVSESILLEIFKYML